eukprot:SAG11_NODE_227_length_11995_cov_4.386601_7_plen_201_part_00
MMAACADACRRADVCRCADVMPAHHSGFGCAACRNAASATGKLWRRCGRPGIFPGLRGPHMVWQPRPGAARSRLVGRGLFGGVGGSRLQTDGIGRCCSLAADAGGLAAFAFPMPLGTCSTAPSQLDGRWRCQCLVGVWSALGLCACERSKRRAGSGLARLTIGFARCHHGARYVHRHAIVGIDPSCAALSALQLSCCSCS